MEKTSDRPLKKIILQPELIQDPKQELEKRVIELYKNHTMYEISKLTRLNYDQVRNLIRHIDFSKRRIEREKILKRNEKIIKFANKKENEEKSCQEIGFKFKCSRLVVSNVLNKNGFKKINSLTIKAQKKIPKIKKLLKQKMLVMQIVKKLHVRANLVMEIRNECGFTKTTKIDKILLVFKKHPNKIIKTTKINLELQRYCNGELYVLMTEGKIERISKGQYRLKRYKKC